MNERREFLTELTPEQEDALLADPKLLLMMYLLLNGWPLAEITSTFAIEDDRGRAAADPAASRTHHRASAVQPREAADGPEFHVAQERARAALLRARSAARVPRLVVRGARRALAVRGGPLVARQPRPASAVHGPPGARNSTSSARSETRRCRSRNGPAAAPSLRCGRGSSRCSRPCAASPPLPRRSVGSTLERMTSTDPFADLPDPERLRPQPAPSKVQRGRDSRGRRAEFGRHDAAART